MKKKLIFLSNIAAPYQVAFAVALNKYFDARFWFYDKIGNRPSFWDVPLNEYCKVLDKVHFKSREKYLTLSHLRQLKEVNPDIVMLGGFTIPANYLAYRWAKKNGKKTIVFTERFRKADGSLRKKGLYMNTLRWLYRDLDLIMVSDVDIIPQFRDDLEFKNKIVAARYSSDIDKYFKHPLRQEKNSYTLIFPNRLTKLYNPIGALEVFQQLLSTYPGLELLLNNDGELKEECVSFIQKQGLGGHVRFLDNLQNWNDLDKVYEQSDIMLLPASFSNGNFTIIEAMASGMGIVISDKILGVGNLIEDGVNGFRRGEDKTTMANSVKEYLEHPELFKKHALQNREKVKHLGANGTAAFYHQIIEKELFSPSK